MARLDRLGTAREVAQLGATVGREFSYELLQAVSVLDEALALVRKIGRHLWETELYRIKGELLLMQGRDTASRASTDEAEACFRKAIEVARHQGAKSWELRAVMSLSRLWQKQGKTEKARRMLQKVYGWFTEGFDTTDLKEAKALLEALS